LPPQTKQGFFAPETAHTHFYSLHIERSSLLNINTEKHRATDENAIAAAPTITRRIGRTTYRVKVHFNPNSRETVNDKIIRMIKNESAGKAAGV